MITKVIKVHPLGIMNHSLILEDSELMNWLMLLPFQ